MAAMIAGASPAPVSATTAMVVAENATAEPTERSTWRATSSRVNGAAMIPTTTAFSITLSRLSGDRKNGLRIEKARSGQRARRGAPSSA